VKLSCAKQGLIAICFLAVMWLGLLVWWAWPVHDFCICWNEVALRVVGIQDEIAKLEALKGDLKAG
jgi:hypothetical protein